jgi:hypothetical protein
MVSMEHIRRYPIVKDVLQMQVDHSSALSRYSGEIHYVLRICGVSQTEARPSILIFCPSEIILQLWQLFSQRHVLDHVKPTVAGLPFPHFDLYLWGQPIELLFSRQCPVVYGAGLDLSIAILSMCGAKIIAGLERDRFSTVGCLLEIGSEYFALTTAHTFDNVNATGHAFEDRSEWTVDESRPDTHGLDDTNPTNTSEAIVTSQSSSYKFINENDTTPADALVRPQKSSQGCEIRLPPFGDHEWNAKEPNLDWALIPVPNREHWRPNAIIVNADLSNPFFLDSVAETISSEGKDVCVITSRSGTLYGQLDRIPAYSGKAGVASCEMWIVTISGNGCKMFSI